MMIVRKRKRLGRKFLRERMKVTQKRKALKRNPERMPRSLHLRTRTLILRRKTERRKKRKRGRNPQVKSPIAKRKDQGRNTRKRKSIKSTRRVRSIKEQEE